MVPPESLFDSREHLRDPVAQALVRSRGVATRRDLARVAALLGQALREERRRRGLTLRDVAAGAGLALGTVHAAETGQTCSLETYVLLARAFRLRLEFSLVDPRRREVARARQLDLVHAAMGEAVASHFRQLGFDAGMDEPFQHYQFAGRADVAVWSVERAAMLHIENKTALADLQDAFGRFNAKRSYLGREFAARVGVARWRSETHVMAALWSTEVLRTIQARRPSLPGSLHPLEQLAQLGSVIGIETDLDLSAGT